MWKGFVRLICILCIALVAAAENASAKRQIPDDNLAYPVLVTLRSGGRTIGSGSGIYINTDDATYLVTARHVLAPGLPDPQTVQIQVPDLKVELLSYSKELPVSQRNVFALDFKTVREAGFVKPSPSRDLVAIRIANVTKVENGLRQITVVSGVTIAEKGGSGSLGAPLGLIRKFDDVLVGNDAILYGYPASLGLPNSHQFDPLRPLLRKAFVAGQDTQNHTLIIDGPVYRGNSGGPVFEIDMEGPTAHFYLVGIITQFIPLNESAPDFEMRLNSGYSVAEPMDFVLELLH
jgi:hypothetical protein